MKRLVGMHPDHGSVFSEFCLKYQKILDFNGITYKIYDLNKSDFFDRIGEVDFFIYRWRHAHSEMQKAKSILPLIENNSKIKVFPNQKTCWHFDDKIRQYYLLKYHGFPVIPSWVFWNIDEAKQFAANADYPIVLKLKGGAGSSNVKLINSEDEAIRHINLLFGKGIKTGQFYDFPRRITRKNIGALLRKARLLKAVKNEYWQIHKGYIYFQKFLPDNLYDIRITTIGSRAFGFTRDNRPGDFRASGSGSLSYDLNRINMECVKLALNISKHFGFQSMAYDFLYDQEKRISIGEISYTYQDKAVYNCNGYWDEDLKWHKGHFWPQYFQLVDLLKLPGLKQPDLT